MTFDSLQNEPLSRTLLRIQSYAHEPHRFQLLTSSQKDGYEHFLQKQFAQAKHDYQVHSAISALKHKPLISIVVPVYNTPIKWLELCVHSVLEQWYENFQLILFDDCSSQKATHATLERLHRLDDRILLVKGEKRRQISLATNEAIKHANGEYVAFMDHDDTIEPFALMEVARAINQFPKADILYSDEDKIDQQGKRFGPYFKSDFDDDLLLANNYISHLCVVRKSLGDQINWLSEGTDGAQDHDFLLRAVEQTNEVVHISKVLYSWRQYPGSTALSHSEKPYALEAGRNAIRSYAARNQIDGEVLDGPWPGAYRLKRTIVSHPLVSIIIPFRDQPLLLDKCVKSILTKTSYANFEIVLVNNNSMHEDTLNLIEELASNQRIRVLEYNNPFNFSDINNFAANHSIGDVLLFLNNDTEVINEEWLYEMVSHIEREDVGIVGANLRYSDNTVQHQGVTLGIGGFAGHVFRHFPADECRHFSQGLVRQYSAVTGACLMTRKKLFLSIGGFDSKNLKIALNDVDYCLEVRKKGLKIIYTPYAQLYHFESKSRGYEDTPEKKARLEKEAQFLINKWRDLIISDPFYNQNLTLDREDFSLR